MNLQQHPLSAAFPSMPEADIESLAEDIKKHGLREPGVLFEDKVLDGWHRYVACERVGVPFKSTQLNGEDPVAFVLSHNLHRRHLTASQRAAAIVSATNWRPLGDQKSRSAPSADRTTKEMAKEAEVSTRTIEYAKTAERAGLGNAVRDGMLTVKDAVKIASGTKSKKKSRKAEPDPEADKHAPNLADELERADKQIREQQELIESLKKGDLAKEVAKWKLNFDQLNGRVQQLSTTTAEAKKTAQYQSDLLAKIRKALKVQKNSEILEAIKR
jgi:hypothetical protein